MRLSVGALLLALCSTVFSAPVLNPSDISSLNNVNGSVLNVLYARGVGPSRQSKLEAVKSTHFDRKAYVAAKEKRINRIRAHFEQVKAVSQENLKKRIAQIPISPLSPRILDAKKRLSETSQYIAELQLKASNNASVIPEIKRWRHAEFILNQNLAKVSNAARANIAMGLKAEYKTWLQQTLTKYHPVLEAIEMGKTLVDIPDVQPFPGPDSYILKPYPIRPSPNFELLINQDSEDSNIEEFPVQAQQQ